MRNLGQTLVRHGYSATFIKKDEYGKYALLFTIMDERHIQICDHVWVKLGAWCERLEPGDIISFTAIPVRYVKRNPHTSKQLEIDITLSDLEDVKVTASIEIQHKELKYDDADL